MPGVLRCNKRADEHKWFLIKKKIDNVVYIFKEYIDFTNMRLFGKTICELNLS